MATNCIDTDDNVSASTSPEESFTCALYDFLIEAVLMGALCAFGFVGNMLSAVCLWRDKSKSATPFLLISLELADTLFLVTVLLLRVLTTVLTFTVRLSFVTVLTSYIGKYVYPLAMMTGTGTIYLTLLVTVNRYISVCKPYDASSLCSIPNARKQVIVVWLFSIMFNIPRCFEYDISEYCHLVRPLSSSSPVSPSAAADTGSQWYEGVRRLRSNPTWLAMDPIYQLVYVNVLYSIIMFLVPLVSLVVLNYNLILALRETRRKRENMRSRRFIDPSSTEYGRTASASISSRSEDDITLMLIVVVVIFVVSQSPALVTQILFVFVENSRQPCPNYFFFYERISDLLVVTNSSVNFIAYCFCSRRFRNILLSLLRGRTSDAELADAVPETNTQIIDRGPLAFRNSNHDVGRSRSSLANSCLNRMTERKSVKTRNFALKDINELQERKPIVG